MIRGDYSTSQKAINYNQNRFAGGLRLVDEDEMKILENWLSFLPRDSTSVLDLGTGTGRALKSILKFSPQVIYAVDQSPAMLAVLKENYPKEIRKGLIETKVGIAQKIPLPSSSINSVVSLHLFKHLDDISSILKEINRVLKSRGLIIFDILNINSLIKFNLGTCYALDKKNIIKILKHNGFTYLKIIPLHIFGETIYNLPGSYFISFIDKFLIKIGLSIGTKFFVLAQKNV